MERTALEFPVAQKWELKTAFAYIAFIVVDGTPFHVYLLAVAVPLLLVGRLLFRKPPN